MILLDGKKLSNEIKEEIAQEVDHIVSQGGRAPHLVTVLVGDDPASSFYVKSKGRACQKVGFKSTMINEPDSISEEDLLAIVHELNVDEEVDGFIVQLPLPKHIDEQKVIMAIDPKKDVDGFHPTNFGKMALELPSFIPATPYGILQMLDRYGVGTSGKKCVVVGRSNIVGKPMSILMANKSKTGNCTVTLTHSRTRDLSAETLSADIIIAAIGIPHFITADMVKDGAVVIDVGINRVANPNAPKGYNIAGDVDFDNVAPKCSHITPVPGGVGLMTVTSLLLNTLKSYKKEV